jgi:hypothetical protein
MKCADLSHEFVEWDQHLDWELRLAEEFYQQVIFFLPIAVIFFSFVVREKRRNR